MSESQAVKNADQGQIKKQNLREKQAVDEIAVHQQGERDDEKSQRPAGQFGVGGSSPGDRKSVV